MFSKRKLLKNARLYLILDTEVNTYEQLFSIVKDCMHLGAGIIQLRDKQGSAKDILRFSRKVLQLTKHRTPYIINDRIDLALVGRTFGVHLGQEDIPLIDARNIMGKKAIIGVSCQTFGQAKKAEQEGADYIGFGSVFKTFTKPKRNPMSLSLLARVVKNIHIPVFAIGGIGLENISGIRSIGVKRVAVCRSICKAKDVRKAVKSFRKSLED